MNGLAKMAATILDEDPEVKGTIVSILAEFFQEAFAEDPAGVADWLVQGGNSVDLFVEFAKLLRSPQEGAVPHD